MPKTILYIAMSEDGFIAGDKDNLDFLNPYQVEGEDYGYGSFMETIGAILVGRRTYEKVLSMGYPYHEDRQVYVITRQNRPSSGKLHFCGGDLRELIEGLKQSTGRNVYCDGGAGLAQSMLQQGLIDEIMLSIIPVLLQRGTLLFAGGVVPDGFECKSTNTFATGLIQYVYELKKQEDR